MNLFRGHWWLPQSGKRVHGALVAEDDGELRLELLDPLGAAPLAPFESHDAIWGHVVDLRRRQEPAVEVSLFRCHELLKNSPMPGRQGRLVVNEVVVGGHFKGIQQCLINSVQIEFHGLEQWFAGSAFAWPPPGGVGDAYAGVTLVSRESIRVPLDAEVLQFGTAAEMSSTRSPRRVSAHESVVVSATPASAMPFASAIRQLVRPLHTLFCIIKWVQFPSCAVALPWAERTAWLPPPRESGASRCRH